MKTKGSITSRWISYASRKYGSFDRRIYVLSLGWLVTATGFAMVIPYITIYFNQELKISTTLIGVFFGFTAILRSVPQPLAGWLSDRVGRVRIMSWSQVARSLTFIAVAYAIFHDMGFWPIAIIIAFNFIFGAVLYPLASAMVADMVPREQRLAAFSFMRIAANLGWALGPALGGFIASKSYPLLFIVGGIIALVSGIYFALALKDIPRSIKKATVSGFSFRDVFSVSQDRLLFRHCLITFILLMTVAQLVAALSLYATGWIRLSQSQLGILFLVNGGLVVLLQIPVSDLFRKMRLTHQMALGSFLYFLGYFLVGQAGGFISLLLCIVVISIAEMIVFPPASTMVANLSPPDQYGHYMGIYGLFQMFGWSLGPTLGGTLLDVFHDNASIMWAVVSFMSLIAGLLYIHFSRRLSPLTNSGRSEDEVLNG